MDNNQIQIQYLSEIEKLKEFDPSIYNKEKGQYEQELKLYNLGQTLIKPDWKNFGYVFKGNTQKYFIAKIFHSGLNKSLEIKEYDESKLHTNTEFNVKLLNYDWMIYKLQQMESILIDGLSISSTESWSNFKINDRFNIPNPSILLKKELEDLVSPNTNLLEVLPDKPKDLEIGNKPLIENYAPNFNFLNLFFNKKKKIRKANKQFNKAIEKWNNDNEYYNNQLITWELACIEINKLNENIHNINNKQLKDYTIQKQNIENDIINENSKWCKQVNDFQSVQDKYNKHIDELKSLYFSGDLNTVEEFSNLILEHSKYPDFIQKKYDVCYNQDNKILIIEYALPPIDTLPTLKEYKWTKNELKEIYITETQLNKNFEKTMYNICLRTIYELFLTDEINALEAICFNGWVNSINKATGRRENNCILSIQVKKNEFEQIDLRNVDSKTCFKSFKGVSSSKLSTITSIQPIIQANRNDKRFVESHNITQDIDKSTNLAAMDWEDFEHLIREVFQKEFSSNGGEVKVTQASRDGGVDAIAFDPDPIRGGKIVIQAKRYTNTVGVSAVRDLYGTVMNEGATKGILVTTSDYGSDSYEFAKGKPITLLNGSNLLYLLEKHGHVAYINIDEARKLIKGLL